MIPNETLSEELKVQPLKEGEVAWFKLVNAFKKAHDREGVNVPEVYLTSDRQYVRDPFKNKRVTIGNVISTEDKEGANGQMFTKKITKGVEFLRGITRVRADEFETFQYLMRRKDNESNTYAKAMGGRKMVFKLVDDKKEISEALMTEDLQFHMQKLIRETKDPLKLKAWAAKLNKSADKSLHIKSYNPASGEENTQAIKLELMQVGKINPKAVMYAADDATCKVRIQIMEALNFGVAFFEEGAYWVIKKDKPEELFRPDADAEKLESFVEYCMSEAGKTTYVSINQALKKALQVDATHRA